MNHNAITRQPIKCKQNAADAVFWFCYKNQKPDKVHVIPAKQTSSMHTISPSVQFKFKLPHALKDNKNSFQHISKTHTTHVQTFLYTPSVQQKKVQYINSFEPNIYHFHFVSSAASSSCFFLPFFGLSCSSFILCFLLPCFYTDTALVHACIAIYHAQLITDNTYAKKLFLKFEMSTKDRDFAIKQSYLLKNATL